MWCGLQAAVVEVTRGTVVVGRNLELLTSTADCRQGRDEKWRENGGLLSPVLSLLLSLLLFLDLEMVPQALRCSSRARSLRCCYQVFSSIRLCRFSTDRYETFHTY